MQAEWNGWRWLELETTKEKKSKLRQQTAVAVSLIYFWKYYNSMLVIEWVKKLITGNVKSVC